MRQQWIDTDNSTNLFSYMRFENISKQYYGIYHSLSIISWINDTGNLKFLYPSNFSSSNINTSIIYNVDENWNKYFNKTGDFPNITLSILPNSNPINESFIVYYPLIYNQNLTGYFGLIFNMNTLMRTFINQSPIYNEYNYNLDEDGTLLYESNDYFENLENIGNYAVHTTISIYNDDWNLTIQPNDTEINSVAPINHWPILAFGGLTTFLAALWINSENKKKMVIMETHKLERDIERQSFQTKKLEALETLTGTIVHNYNNILMKIEGSISLLKQCFEANIEEIKLNNDQDIKDSFNLIERSINEAGDYNKQISEFSKCSEFELERIELNSIVRETITIFNQQNEENSENENSENMEEKERKNLRIIPTYNEDPIFLMGNKFRFQQLFANIFINSKESITDKGVITVDISLIPREKIIETNEIYDPNRELLIRIADNSIGIPEEDIDRVFDPFYSTKKNGKGRSHGFELAISYNIIKHLGGFMQLNSFENKGIEISINLPILRKEDISKDIELNQLTLNDVDQDIHKKPKILIVEDETIIAKTIQKYFKHKNLDADFYESGLKGLNAYKSNPYDYFVIILDINLPDLNGIEIYEEIRKINKNQLIIFMTGYTESEIPKNDVCILKVLIKPFSFQEFDVIFDKINKKNFTF